MKMRIAFLSSILILSAGVRAADPPAEAKEGDDKVAVVAVNDIRDPELKPYRIMSAGLDAFDEYHRLAPAATLRFKLSRRSEANEYGGSWQGVSLRLAGNESSTPIPIAADGSFVLPRSQQAYDDDADLILNQKRSLIRVRPEVRTPGIPASARRLGDLRLECKVIVAIGKKELNFAQRMAINTFMLGGDWCAKGIGKFGFALPDRSISATVSHGGTKKLVPSAGFQMLAPIQDKSLPDDALIELEFWSAASTERKQQFFAQWPIKLKSSVNKWGAGSPLRLKEAGRYSTELALKPGKWEFCFASPGGEINLGGAAADTPVLPGVDHALQWHWKNLAIQIEQAGTYEFSLNVQDPDHPLVNVKRVEATPVDAMPRN